MVYGVDKLGAYGIDDLWIFTYETGKTRFKDYEKFCNNGRFQEGNASFLNKQNMNQYLKQLREEKKIVRGIDEKEGFKYNYVPQERINEVKKLIEDRRIAQGIESLSKEEREKILSKMRGDDQNKILSAIGQNGSMRIPEIAQKTGFTELKVKETIWGPMLNTGTISADKESHLPAKFRKYGLSVLGLYRALRVDMDNFDVTVERWGSLHPFVFGRLELLRKYKLEPALKEFISRLQLQSHTAESGEATLRRIETYLVSFIISGYNYQYLPSWFGLIHEDQEFRERVKTCFKGFIDGFQQDIAAFQHGVQTIDMLSSRKPNWEEIKWRELSLAGLEWFMHFQEINWDY
jgi:hypothetical protein